MRITRETLLKIARDTVSQRTRTERGLLAVYLDGSLLEDEFLLGGATDIDLVFIHADSVPVEREIVHLTDEVHLDIAHYFHRDFRQVRALRVHPWMGPALNHCKILYDPQHFLDFTQASVRGQFDEPTHILERVNQLLGHARQIWLAFHEQRPPAGQKEVMDYLRALGHAANAVAVLSGPPLTERRFLLRFPQRADAAGKPGLYPGLLGLLGAANADSETMRSWLPAWEAAYLAVPVEQASPRLHPQRRIYYRKAIDAILGSDRPQAALWPLLHTWTLAISTLPVDSLSQAPWREAVGQLGVGGESFTERVDGLDAYLDTIEETLDRWARANGVYAEEQ
jgi:hypothetical protein